MTLAYAYITAVDGFTGEITLSNFPGGASSVSTLYVLPVAAPLFLQGADGDTLEALSDQIDGIGAGGLTAQETADAVYNLAPAGSPATGSLGAQVAAILEDTGDTLPAAIAAIGSGTGAALNYPVSGDNASAPLLGVTAVGAETGTYANTLADDGTKHQIASVGNEIDWVYMFEVGVARAASKIDLRGNMAAVGDTVTVSAYNFLTTSWDARKTITGTTETLYDIPLLAAHTGTGVNEGKVYIRFQFNEGDAGTLVINEAYVQAQQSGSLVGYVEGIEVDTVSGTAGTVPYVNGTKDNPVDSWADALTLSALTNIKQFKIHGGSSITLTADSSNFEITGWAYDLALGGQTITNAHIVGARVTGIGVVSGTAPVFEYCGLGAVTLGPARLYQCGIGRASGTFTAGSAGQFVIVDCFSLVPGSGTPVFNFAGTGSATGVNFRRWSGGSNITADSDVTATMEVVTGGGQTLVTGGGNFELRGICRAVTITLTGGETVQVAAVTGPIAIGGNGTGSTVNLYGVHGIVTNTASGSPTVSDYGVSLANIDSDVVSNLATLETHGDITWSTADLSALATAADLATVDGIVDDIKAKTDNLPADPAATSDIPSVGDISDGVWDETLADHTAVGSSGEALAAAGVAGDPWLATLPGAYMPDSAGYILGTNLDAPVSDALTDIGDLDTAIAALPVAIDVLLTAEHGAGLWTDSSGTGSIMFPYLVTNPSLDPIPHARVVVTTDEDGDNRYAMGYSDAFGYARFHLDAGTYYFWTYAPGYAVSRSDPEVVA